MTKYVVDYKVVRPDGTVRNLGQRDIESFSGLDATGHAQFVATLIAAQIVLPDPTDRIVVTDIRPA